MALDEPIKMMLPFEGKMLLATVTYLLDDFQFQFFIEFENGYRNTFFTDKFENEKLPLSNIDAWPGSAQWAEDTLGTTEFSTIIGAYIETYLKRIEVYEEPFAVSLGQRRFVVQPETPFDETIFRIFQNDEYACEIHMNNDGAWETLNQHNEFEGGLIQAIGNRIEIYL